jgi:hypothetical protein
LARMRSATDIVPGTLRSGIELVKLRAQRCPVAL